MAEYRWNQSEMAAGYDAGAALVHPFYVEVQDAILERLPFDAGTPGLVIDLGGGSGRLIERILNRWPLATALIVDQSQAFLDLAAARLENSTDRVELVCRRLQDDWTGGVTPLAAAIVSMSAIHHLDPAEKQQCYQRCHDVLKPGGILLNGDEVRADSDEEYRQHLEVWALRMQELIDTKAVTPAMADGLQKWQQRNVGQFGAPRSSGDDCHETATAQLQYFEQAGFSDVRSVWQRELWTVLEGRKSRE